MHPKSEIEKTYVAKLNRIPSGEELAKIKHGIKIDDRVVEVKRLKVKKKDTIKDTAIVEITIIEGRNHIVKRLFNSLRFDVIKLSRISYGFLNINDLKSGEYRMLTIKEIKKLYSEVKNRN
jgi:23S rRNA pseudouridine2605 synthase